MPLWCCTHHVSGCAAHCTRQWTSCAVPARVSSGGTYSARMPSAPCVHVAPASLVRHTPPIETRDRDVLRIARIDADRVNAGVVLATAAPLRAVGHEPQRLDDLPRCAAILGAEQAAGDRAAPERAVLVERRCERPDQRGRPLALLAPEVLLDLALGLLRILRDRDLGPRRAAIVGAVELDAEVAVVERRVPPPVAAVGKRNGDVVTQKFDLRDLPLLRLARGRKQAFAGRNDKRIAHHQPPDRA